MTRGGECKRALTKQAPTASRASAAVASYNDPVRLPLAAVVLLAVLPGARQQPAPPEADTAALLAHASRWTARLEQSLSGLLFRERFLQRVNPSRGGAHVPLGMTASPTGSPRQAPRLVERILESNVFLLRVPASPEVVLYRDTYRVANRDIGDHTNRLQTLLAEGTASAMARARKLTDESARHNLSAFDRNVNVPTMALDYLAPRNVGRIRVRQAGRDTVEGLAVVILEFEETGRPTLVSGDRGADVVAKGRYWIHPESGAVVRAIVELATERTTGRLEVQLQLHEQLKVWVPRAMTEVWTSASRELTGLASYDRFQRLNVTTSEIMK